MQDPNEDTQWNDILRAKGIIPEKKKEAEVTEDQIVDLLENTINERTGRAQKDLENATLDELDELEDEEDEKVLQEFRAKRIAEWKALVQKNKYGDVYEISAQDYVQEVNKAPEGTWVILHLYKQGIPLCSLVNQHLKALALKFSSVKFLKSISTTCIPNYPDAHLPTLFIYRDGNMQGQIVGPIELRGMNLTEEELEYMLGKIGAVPTNIKDDPKKKVQDILFRQLEDLAESNDW
ncbi:viral IAP-associated factor homolog [Trichogramma pretiosum]|uniref:viral IAP-associated factor homolog n=1 Tax=Trichogramma pretiosum TaxID=7493 RepID=UPI0006C9E028|nr:viral IAP-associated factor homolog [Trichogramma pretiosum]